jgi:hypothetical protein
MLVDPVVGSNKQGSGALGSAYQIPDSFIHASDPAQLDQDTLYQRVVGRFWIYHRHSALLSPLSRGSEHAVGRSSRSEVTNEHH